MSQSHKRAKNLTWYVGPIMLNLHNVRMIYDALCGAV